MKISFNKRYFLAFFALFVTEVLIAKFMTDSFIRPFVGDYLVMILIYLFSRTWLKGNDRVQIFGVLLFCYSVEIAQKFNLVQILGLEQYRLARIIIGTHYDVNDLVAYSLAALTLLLLKNNWLSRALGIKS
nr:DUF2809 domain-containing protein [uncultured Tolumonas sp.]